MPSRAYISLGSQVQVSNVSSWICSVLCAQQHRILHCFRCSFSRPTNMPFTSHYSNATSQPDNDIVRLLAFQTKLTILTATDADAIRAFLQSWTNYKETGILSLIDCINADARTALELVYTDQLYRGQLPPSDIDLEFLRCLTIFNLT